MLGLDALLNVVDPVRLVLEVFKRESQKATEAKQNYADKLEQASGDDVFKYVLLINVASLEGYVAQTRIQAAQSFRLSSAVALVGFLLIAIGVGFGFYLSAMGSRTLDMAYLASGAGIVTEFISGVFFYLYSRTLQQINRFHDRLISMQQTSMSFLASSLVTDAGKRDDAKIALSSGMLSMAAGGSIGKS